MEPGTAVAELVDASRTYEVGEARVEALKPASISFARADSCAIMGPSGSGKSTMLQLLGALDRPTTGRVLVDGVDVSRLGDRELSRVRNQKIGFVFQAFHLYPTLSALKNVELPMSVAQVPRAERRTRARALLERVGLATRLHHAPSQLSGGEKQRVAIARALANDPLFILADEPTGALDSQTGESVLDLLRSIQQEGKTLILVTHDALVARMARRVIRLHDGSIVKEATA